MAPYRDGKRDWSFMKQHVDKKVKSWHHSETICGTFDFDVSYQPPDLQRQRRAKRRRIENADEKKATKVHQKNNTDKVAAWRAYTFDVIKKVCNPFPFRFFVPNK